MEEKIYIENKAKFFAQYWGQPIQTYKLSYSWRRSVNVDGSVMGYITLTPLSDITDEDAIEVGTICNSIGSVEIGEMALNHIFNNYDSDNFLLISPIEISQIIDHLRSKGYALPWMGLSVEEMVKAGWIKLT